MEEPREDSTLDDDRCAGVDDRLRLGDERVSAPVGDTDPLLEQFERIAEPFGELADRVAVGHALGEPVGVRELAQPFRQLRLSERDTQRLALALRDAKRDAQRYSLRIGHALRNSVRLGPRDTD